MAETGLEPSPEERRDFEKRVLKLLRDEADPDRVEGDLLIKREPDEGIEPYDPHEDAAVAATRGVDLTIDPAWRRLARLYDEAMERAGRRAKGVPDPRKVTKAITLKKERMLKRGLRREEVAAKGRRVSRKSRERWRRDAKRDQATLLEIHGFLAAGVGVHLLPSRAHLVRAKKTSGLAFGDDGAVVDTSNALVAVPHWEKATATLRAFGMCAAAGTMGARDFTLHLNDAVLVYAQGGDGNSFAKRIARRIKDALAREFAKDGVASPDFMFFVEQGVGERAHLHGIITIPHHRRATKAIWSAMKRAGGEPWKPTPHTDTQFDLGELSEPIGWVRYITKYSEITRAQVGPSTFASTNAMRATGRQWYEDARKHGRLILPGKAVPI